MNIRSIIILVILSMALGVFSLHSHNENRETVARLGSENIKLTEKAFIHKALEVLTAEVADGAELSEVGFHAYADGSPEVMKTNSMSWDSEKELNKIQKAVDVLNGRSEFIEWTALGHEYGQERRIRFSVERSHNNPYVTMNFTCKAK